MGRVQTNMPNQLKSELELLEFKKKFLTPEEFVFLQNNPLPKTVEAKFRAFVNLSLDAAIPLVIQKKGKSND